MTKSTKSFTVLYKESLLDGKMTDNTVYTFTTDAVSESDAIRKLRMSRMYSMVRQDRRFKKRIVDKKSFRVKPFTVVRVFTGDGVGRFMDYDGNIQRKVTVIPPRQPRWMMRNYFGSK